MAKLGKLINRYWKHLIFLFLLCMDTLMWIQRCATKEPEKSQHSLKSVTTEQQHNVKSVTTVSKNKVTGKSVSHLEGIRTKHFCHDVNANWPKNFPKVVEKKKYLEQKIPHPFFEFSKWNNSHLDSIGEIISPNKDRYNSIDIISVISSSWSAVEARLAMRQTLGTLQYVQGYSHNLLFLIGQTPKDKAHMQKEIQKEAKLYGDILQLNIDDSYRGMTKKRFQGHKWAIEVCQKASLVLYLTDDVVVNIPNMIKYLQPIREKKKLAYGGINYNIGKVISSGKVSIYSEPALDWTTHPYTPDYLMGFGMVFSMDVAIDVYKLVCKTPLTFSDDRYIGILLSMLGVPLVESGWRLRDKEDQQWGKSYDKTKLKELIKTYNPTLTHLYSDDTTGYIMREVWKDLRFDTD